MHLTTQEAAGQLKMSGTESMEWHQTDGNHMLAVFDIIPLQPLQ
jgi:hypothetical protein